MTRLIVNGEAIDPERIREETAAIAKSMAEQAPDEDPIAQRMRAREWAEENLIEEAVLRQAKAAGRKEPEPPRPSRVVTKAVYQKNPEAFTAPEMVHAAHIVCNVDEKNDEEKARAAIERARAELAKGRAFGEVADELSDCPGRGGDLGWFPRGQMVQAFDDAVFGLAAGEVSGIFRTEFGFHIAQVIEKRKAGVKPFEDVRTAIEEELLVEKRQEMLYAFLDELVAKAEIQRLK
jgi:parvulin-like peptidyl-prolyl isomerase